MDNVCEVCGDHGLEMVLSRPGDENARSTRYFCEAHAQGVIDFLAGLGFNLHVNRHGEPA